LTSQLTDTHSSVQRSLARAAAGTFGVNIAVAVLSFANVLVIARALGPEGRGDVALLTTIALLTAALANLGVQQANVNFASRSPELRPALRTNSVVLAALLGGLGVVAVAVLVTAVPAARGTADPALVWVALGVIPILILGSYLQDLVLADYEFKLANAAWLLPAVLTLAVNAILAAVDLLSVASAMIAWVAAQAAATLVLLFRLLGTSDGFARPDRALARRMLGFGAKTHVGRIMMYGNFRLDQWIVGGVSGSRELGLYSIAVAWAEVLYFLPTSLVRVQRPALARAARSEAGRRAVVVFRAASILTAATVLGIIVASPILTAWIFGPEFRGAGDDLRVLALGGFGVVALKILGNALTAQGMPLRETAGIAAAFAATVALDVLLIPAYGGLGAAVASAVAYGIGGLLIILLFCRAFGRGMRDVAPRPADVVWLHTSVRRALRPASTTQAPIEPTS
jgi:O-antigen/teichoic acid export membrane protein